MRVTLVGSSWAILPFLLMPGLSWADKMVDADTVPGSAAVAVGRADPCRELAPGESRTVRDVSRSASPTGLPRSYKVTRDKDDPKQFNVELKVFFIPDARLMKRLNLSLGEGYNSKDWERFDEDNERRANWCFDQYKRYLRDKDGRTLNIRLSTKNAAATEGVPSSKVKLVDSMIRSNSENWYAGESCRAVVHEILHLLGLVDGYREKSLKTASGAGLWDCRAVERKDSLMASGEDAKREYEGLLVECQCVSLSCRKRRNTFQIVNNGGVKCPPGSLRKARRTSLDLTSSGLTETKDGTGNGIDYRFLAAPSNYKPLLGRAQIMAVTKPYCVRDNVYMACAKNAYRSSSEPGGCLDMPPECRQKGWPE